MSGVTHSKKMKDGTVVSICSVFNMETKKMDLVIYKMLGDNIHKRLPIAKVEQKKNSYQHGFALTKDYAIVFMAPWHFQPNLFELMFANVHLQELIKNDVNGTTLIHVVRLADGKVTTLDAKKWSMILHFGNAWQKDDDTIVVDGPAYEDPNANPFTIFMHDKVQDAKGVCGNSHGAVYKRYILNLKTLEVQHEDLLVSRLGATDLP